MAVMEDMVSIGFEVQKNPLSDLTAGLNHMKSSIGILDTLQVSLKHVGKEVNTVAKDLDGLKSSLNGLSKLVGDFSEAAKDAQKETSRLIGLLLKTSKINLVDGMKTLSTGLKNPKEAFKGLAGQAKSFAKLKLDAGVKKLPQLVGKAEAKLIGTLKKIPAAGLKSIAGLGTGMAKSLGNAAIKGLGIGVSAATDGVLKMGTASIAAGSKFEASMSQVAATMGMSAEEADYSNATYAKLAQTAKEMGVTTKFSAAESAEALNYLALAGYDADGACGALPTVLNLASAGGMDLAEATGMVADSMSALGIEATQENMAQFGDQLAKTAQESKTSIAQMGEAVLTVGDTSKTLAGGAAELNTLLGIIAENGVKGAEGGSALCSIMESLQAPTDAAAEKMKSLGVNVFDAGGKMRPMNDVLGDFNTSMDGMTDRQRQDAISTIFNSSDIKSVNALLASSGERYDELRGSIDGSAGAMENMARTMSDNLTGKITEFKGAAEGTGIAIYEALGRGNMKGLVSEATGWITDLTKATEAGGLEGLAAEVGTVLSKISLTVTGYLPQLVQGGVDIVDSLIAGIMQNRDQIAQNVMAGLTAMVMGIMVIAPELLNAGVLMLGSMLQGLEQQMPGILSAGLTATENLCAGLIANMPAIIQSGIGIILQLIQGLIAAAPVILTTGIQLVMMLAQGLTEAVPTFLETGVQLVGTLVQGLIEAIPNLIGASFNLIGAIWDTFWGIDWLKIGLDLVAGIGSGVVNGIKGLFGKGKDAGAEVTGSIASGMEGSLGDVESASSRIGSAAGAGFLPDGQLLFQRGSQSTSAYGDGLQAGAFSALNSAENISGQIEGQFGAFDLSKYGYETTQSLSQGLLDGSGQVAGAAAEIRGIADEAANIKPAVSANTSASGIETTQSQVQQLAVVTQASLSSLQPLFDQTLAAYGAAITKETLETETVVKNGCDMVVRSTGIAVGQVKAQVDGLSLYQSGVNIMAGLNYGMLSMKEQLLATASGIAWSVSGAINQTLQIHSPSRITEKSGEFAGLGMVKGMQNVTGKITRTAQAVGMGTAQGMNPPGSRYSPEYSPAANNRMDSQVNTWNPIFNLTLNGASASDSNERKVKRWVKEAMKEAWEGMGRTNPRLQEV